jgi:Polysaccharide pyruvyl transferase
MARLFRPFVLNSNIRTDAAAIQSHEMSMVAVNHNTGNSYISYAVLKGLFGSVDPKKVGAGINNIWLEDLPRQADEINATYSHVLLFMQDQIRADNQFAKWDELNNLLQQIRIPIVVFSLGANSFAGWDANLHTKLSPGLIRFLNLLAERTAVLGIRGEFTADVLTKLGIKNHQITGCPSYFECGRARRVVKRDWNPEAKVLATGLFSNAEHNRLHYVLQSESVLLKALFSVSPELESTQIDLLDGEYLGYRECVAQAFQDKRVSVFFDPEQWKAFIAQGFAFAAGTRLHGAIIALNAGIPALVTNGDMRAKEVTDYFGIPYRPGICGMSFGLQELYEQLDIDLLNRRYDAVFADYCGWLELNGLSYLGDGTESKVGRCP